jgi:hypothetical protein
MMKVLLVQAIAALLVAVGTAEAKLTNKRFEEWLWSDQTFASILRTNCSEEYDNYIDKINTGWYTRWPEFRPYNLSDMAFVYSNPLVTCLLENTNELNKADMASSGILLGLMPTILASVGSTLGETTLLASRRPILAMLLAIGSPAVPVLRTFERQDVHRMLRQRPGKQGISIKMLYSSQGKTARRIVVCLEFCLALAALINVVTIAWELAIKTIVSWSADRDFHQLLWVLLPGPIHVVGACCFFLDVKVKKGRSEEGEHPTPPTPTQRRTVQEHLYQWIQDEFSLCVTHSETSFRDKPDSLAYFAFQWLAAMCTVAHFIYGTA